LLALRSPSPWVFHALCMPTSQCGSNFSSGRSRTSAHRQLPSEKLLREHKQSLSARFPRRNTARSTPFLAVAATSERCHRTISHPLTGISPVTTETLTRERSCTCSRPSQHTQRLPCHALSAAVLCKRPLHTLRKAFTVRRFRGHT
jgi:hypothetical protein